MPIRSPVHDVVVFKKARPPAYQVAPPIDVFGSFKHPECGTYKAEVASEYEALIVPKHVSLGLHIEPQQSVNKQCSVRVQLVSANPEVLQVAPTKPQKVLVGPGGFDGGALWTGSLRRGGEDALSLRIESSKGELLATLEGQSITVEPNDHIARARSAVAAYLSKISVSGQPTGGERDLRPGRHAVIDAELRTEAVNRQPGMAGEATLKICIRGAGAAASEERCQEVPVNLGTSEHIKLPVDVGITTPGRVELIYDLDLSYQIDGSEQGYARSTNSSAGQADSTTIEKVSGGLSRLNATLVALGGAAGVIALITGIVMLVRWIRKRKTRKRDSLAGKDVGFPG